MIKETNSKFQRAVLRQQKLLAKSSAKAAKERQKENTERSFSGSFKFDPYIPPRREIKASRINPLSTKDLNLENKVVYEDEELIERERIAQEEIERKKKQVAPMYSKGAYQYITSPELLHDLGKKK